MEINIVVSKDLYQTYKKELYALSPRLFCDEYFYQFPDYENPIELNGMQSFLSFVTKVHLYATSSFLDFINILLVCDFLISNHYAGWIHIGYALKQNKPFNQSIYAESTLSLQDMKEVPMVIQAIKQKKEVHQHIPKILGFDSFIQFYNQTLDVEFFKEINEELLNLDNIDEKVAFLMEKYSQFHLNKEYYETLLKEMNEE